MGPKFAKTWEYPEAELKRQSHKHAQAKAGTSYGKVTKITMKSWSNLKFTIGAF
jgi:hypothetical protein